ncbi:PstS family phosphate ABC transporter substrate-binding protein [Bythopirellula goksoeyrii]|uniref:PBP superfamily domain protein n=1 Tax=Bythopirellula goksoeyrii TaxID=1400387 RepID=A0A5B9Q6Y4_9BACT|nr:PstS family phosphate ABC transporter substrate-binding protein [Bythopirellula goksoeyrii]QEG33470.1 PBP superfamily domain protein [Bythopirellula goksoeyrii]
MRHFASPFSFLVLALLTVGQSFAETLDVPLLDPNLPYYRPVEKLAGELKLGGSNTMSHVASGWINSFTELYPDVNITVEVNGSREAVESVQKGDTHIGLLSRTISAEEVESFQNELGYPPVVLTPCLERTAIYVNKNNPIEGMTIAQLDAVFGSECKRGAKGPCHTWGQVGLTGKWAKMPITVHARTFDTGSQVFIQEAVLLGAPIREDMISHKSNIEIVDAVAKDEGGVGFGGLSYTTSEVKTVPLAFTEGQEFVAIDSPEADMGMYPLVRRLQLVVKHDPKQDMNPVEQEFIRYVFSRMGQEDVLKAGYQAIPARPARVALDAVGLGLSR